MLIGIVDEEIRIRLTLRGVFVFLSPTDMISSVRDACFITAQSLMSEEDKAREEPSSE